MNKQKKLFKTKQNTTFQFFINKTFWLVDYYYTVKLVTALPTDVNDQDRCRYSLYSGEWE